MGMIELGDVLAGTGGAPDGGPPASGAATVFAQIKIDSRAVAPGDLFVAVRGETHDGHCFVRDAAARGATGALIAAGRAGEFADLRPGLVLIEVDDTLAALGRLASYWRGGF